jgi:purine-binding chemotaxis protein CheW
MNRNKQPRTIDWDDARQRLDSAMRDQVVDTTERTQRVLEQRAASLARVPPSSQRAEAQLELLCFKLGSQRCAIEMRFVNEVQKPMPITRLPGAPAHLLGITSLRGEILPVFDVRELLHAGNAERAESARVLVLGETGPDVCVTVDAVYEIRVLAADSVLDSSQSRFGVSAGYLRGVTSDALVVLDAAALLADRQLFVGDADEPIQEGNS